MKTVVATREGRGVAPGEKLFETRPVRIAARRGRASRPIERRKVAPDCWPRPDRDEVDVALVAARVLAISGRLRNRLRVAARAAGVEPDILLLLLVFSESNRWLRITDIAYDLGIGKARASRLTARADAAGLIDKHTNAVDGREVACRLSVAGRSAAVLCLDSLRPVANVVLRPADRDWVISAQRLLEPAERFERRTQNSGWRAGVRAGMPNE